MLRHIQALIPLHIAILYVHAISMILRLSCGTISLPYTEVPDPPVSVMVLDIGARWLALRWTPTFDGNRLITSFVIYPQNINLTSSFMSLGTLQVSNLMFHDGNFMYNVTTDILPFMRYGYSVQACNVLGCSNVSQPSPTVMTLPDSK